MPHTNCDDSDLRVVCDSDLRMVCCCDCGLAFPKGLWPRCSDCGLFRCSGCELYLQVSSGSQPVDRALAEYSTRVARARAVVRARADLSEGSSSSHEPAVPAVSAIAPIPTRPPIPPIIPPIPTRPTVPSGWEAVWSPMYHKYYYWHPATDHTQWEDPNWEAHEIRKSSVVTFEDFVDLVEPTTTTGTKPTTTTGTEPSTTTEPTLTTGTELTTTTGYDPTTTTYTGVYV